ncbi:hypothetical protein CkaCkLH20_07570 [Colletotrichum karsti]|uniref:Uncharacterized protein n=1 Tax=Colletotrichum karsti TaxID=1095194 RepID=A0A9P6LJ61_9PEZI|nr:uncharacterized protein CkaCkLH20_07570 [Colletotrichum karsti]KAF9874876.1 hypothetical protein CkaCkLH20_07570 [Colletotrichum karsti]
MTRYDSPDDKLLREEERLFRDWLKGLGYSRPATRADLGEYEFTVKKQVLLFEKSGSGALYVESLIRRFPASVSSKRLHIKLPPELWLDVLDYCSLKPDYVLVVPQSTTPDGKLVLWEVRNRQRSGKPPAEEVFELDLAYLDSNPGVLLTSITHQDVIARVEGGDCGDCLGKRATTSGRRRGLRPCSRCTGYYFAKTPRDGMDPAWGVVKKKCVTLGYGYEVFTACGLPVPTDRDVDKLSHLRLDDLVERKPVLVLNKLALSARYLESLVRETNNIIRPTNGNTTLPLELWLDIVEIAFEQLAFSLVVPEAVEGLDTPNPTLVCREFTEAQELGCSRIHPAVPSTVSCFFFFAALLIRGVGKVGESLKGGNDKVGVGSGGFRTRASY